LARVSGRILGGVATVVTVVGAVAALLLVGHIVLTFLNANADNPVTRFFAGTAGALVLWFDGLFTPADPKMAVLVNYAIAAVFWLVAAAIVARILRAMRW
jgi:hypothetical protein